MKFVMNNTSFGLVCLILLTVQNCTMIKINVSEKRNSSPQKIEMGKGVTLTTWGAIRVNKSHFFPSSFQLKTENEIIYIDPVGINTTEKGDYILITHSHPDHFSLEDIEKILKPQTEIICSQGVKGKLKKVDNKVQVVKPGDSLQLNGFTLEATAAYNTKSVFLWIKAHPKSKENVGFILTLSNGLKIYHAGDTDFIPEMRKISNIDLALLPIGGDNLTMNEQEAAQIVNEIQPTKVFPMHFEIKEKEIIKQFKNLVKEPIEVIEIE